MNKTSVIIILLTAAPVYIGLLACGLFTNSDCVIDLANHLVFLVSILGVYYTRRKSGKLYNGIFCHALLCVEAVSFLAYIALLIGYSMDAIRTELNFIAATSFVSGLVFFTMYFYYLLKDNELI